MKFLVDSNAVIDYLSVSVLVWSRNLLNTNYFEQLLPAAGNVGQDAAVLGDQRTFGYTLRYNF